MLVSDFAQTCMTTKAVKTLNQNISTPIFVFLGAYDGVIFYVYPTAEKVANLKNIGVRNIDTKNYNTTLNKNYFALHIWSIENTFYIPFLPVICIPFLTGGLVSHKIK